MTVYMCYMLLITSRKNRADGSKGHPRTIGANADGQLLT